MQLPIDYRRMILWAMPVQIEKRAQFGCTINANAYTQMCIIKQNRRKLFPINEFFIMFYFNLISYQPHKNIINYRTTRTRTTKIAIDKKTTHTTSYLKWIENGIT